MEIWLARDQVLDGPQRGKKETFLQQGLRSKLRKDCPSVRKKRAISHQGDEDPLGVKESNRKPGGKKYRGRSKGEQKIHLHTKGRAA